MRAQHAVETGLTGDVDPFVRQRRNDPRRRGRGKTRFVGHLDDPCPFGIAQGVRRNGAARVRPAISPRQTVAGLPTPQRVDGDANQSTGRGNPRSLCAGLRDVTCQGLAVFQAGHSSASLWKTAELSLPIDENSAGLPADPQRKRELMLLALLRPLDALAARQPVLMVFEDAHWADSTSLELLDRAIQRTKQLPVLLVITFRPAFRPPWTGQANVFWMSLNRLGQADTALLVDGIARGKALPPIILKQIVERTDGIPLFVEELTRSVLEGGFLRSEAGSYVLTEPLPSVAIPASLQASLLARMARERRLILRDELQPLQVVAEPFELAQHCCECPIVRRQQRRGYAVQLRRRVLLHLAVGHDLAFNSD